MNILRFNGDDDRLFQLVARLVMNKDVLASNNNYPFKTSPDYQWFVACENNSVVAFLPVCVKNNKATINNYYVSGDNCELLADVVKCVIEQFAESHLIISVAHTRHLPLFQNLGFSIILQWAKYVKMIYNTSNA